MASRTCDVAIIGAGTAGLHAYKAADRRGADALLIEQGEGGSLCTRSGCIPSKLLLAAARAAEHARRASVFGVGVGEVTVDGPAVMRRLRAERDKADGRIRDQYLAIPDGHRLRGRARFTGPGTLAVGDVEVTARAIIVATGSTAQVPPSLDAVRPLVRTNETIFDLEDLPRAMAVLGAGPLGLELAQAFSRLGVEVTMLDESGEVGNLADPEAEHAARAALTRGFAIHSRVKAAAEPDGDRARVRWTGDSEGEVVVDLVLAAAGRAPALDGLDLERSGAPLDERGTPVFDPATRRCGETAVYVAGDAGAKRPVLHEAARAGTVAATVATGGGPFRPLPSLGIAFTEPNLAQVGTGFGDLPDGAVIGTARAEDNARSGIDADAQSDDCGLVRLYADRSGKLLGGTLVLTGAEHLSQALALAVERGLTLAELADQAWYHPVLEEMLQEAARDAARQLGIETV